MDYDTIATFIMNFIWVGVLIFALYLLSKYEDKIGRNSDLYYFLLFFILLITGIILWDIIGLDSGSGGSPYGDVDLYFSDF